MGTGVLRQSLENIVKGCESRRIRVVVGDGLAAVDRIATAYHKRGAVRWNGLESARILTLKGHPPRTYYLLWQLVKIGVVDCIVTTNYDCYLDSILSEISGLPASINPLLIHPAEVPCSPYCAMVGEHPRRVWKIHGSLRAAFLPLDGHIICLPQEPLQCLWRSDSWQHAALSAKPMRRTDEKNTYCHLIDWNSSRSRFRRLIKDALNDLLNENETAAILVLGFKGYYDFQHPRSRRNEEITRPLLEASARMPVHVVISEKQSLDGNATLWNMIHEKNPSQTHIGVEAYLFDLLSSVTGWTPTQYRNEYLKWIRQLGSENATYIAERLVNGASQS